MKFPIHYILGKDGEPQAEPNLFKWARWFEDNFGKMHVADEMIGAIRVSTVFLGINQGLFFEGPPILWETRTFGPGADDCESCSGSREQAEAMHARIVQKLKNRAIQSIAPPNKDAL